MALDGIIGETHIEAIQEPRVFLHVAIWLADGRVVDSELFRLVGFQGHDSVSSPFEYQLQLHANTDPAASERIGFEDIIGRPISFAVEKPSEEASSGNDFQKTQTGMASDRLSLFHGMVTAFSLQEPGVYSATVKPRLWNLTLSNHYRIHAQLSIRDAIQALLDEHEVAADLTALEDRGNPAINRVQDWLQAGETDFDFMQRLMAKAHIYYYFLQEGNAHRMVFANQAHYPKAYPDGRKLRYCYTQTNELALDQDDVITQYNYQQSLQSSSVNGVFTRQENAWEEDCVAGYQSFQATSERELGDIPFHLYKIYQYGCSDAEVTQYTGTTADTIASARSQFSGASQCLDFRSGFQFQLSGEVDDQSNPSPVRPCLKDQWFVLTQVQHKASLDGGYQNQFSATEARGLVTPFSMNDTHQGSMIARVVKGANGIPPKDWRYYYKNNFDPVLSKADDAAADPTVLEAKGVYVEFSSSGADAKPVWVKLAPHMQTAPEIGALVMVSRANDDSELPEIQNIVQANGSKVVTPHGWTANTNVGSNYSTSYGDSKSVRFGLKSIADLDVAVARITEKYAINQYRDCSFSQGGSYSYSTSEDGKSGLLSDSDSFGSTYSRHQGVESKSCSDIDYSYSKQRIGDTDSYSVIDNRSYSESIIGETENHSTIVTDSTSYQTINGKSYSESTLGESENHSTIIGDSKSYQTVNGESYSKSNLGKVTSDTTITGKQYSKSVVEGASESINEVQGHSSSKTTLSTASNVTVAVAQTSSSAIGAENRNSVVDITNSNSLTGIAINNSLTAVNNNNSLTEISLNLSGTLVNTEISATGVNNKVSKIGVSNFVEVVGGRIVASSAPAEAQAKLKGTDVSLMSAIKLIM